MKLPIMPQRKHVQDTRFPISTFWLILGVLLLTTGIHIGLIVLMQVYAISGGMTTHLILFYWLAVSVLITLILRRRFLKAYDEPTKKISEAMEQISRGDFSVRIQPFHEGKKMDYLDYMILDLNKMTEELSSIETLKTDFISNVSHEMKTPLSVIKNYAELMQKDDIDKETYEEYAEVIADAAERMSDLVSNILRLNRLEHQNILPERENFDLCRQLCDCVLLFETKWEAKEIEIEMDLEDRARITSEPNFLALVWNNLIANAIKFTPRGGSVTVSQSSTADTVTVTVKDTGCGINAEHLEHIFEKFFQADASRATEGNGLGLALVKQVLTLLGGSIAVESEPGKGSAFTVTLPRET